MMPTSMYIIVHLQSIAVIPEFSSFTTKSIDGFNVSSQTSIDFFPGQMNSRLGHLLSYL